MEQNYILPLVWGQAGGVNGMRFTSYRLKSGKWICCCIVKRRRPFYDRLNTLLSGMEGLAQWYIVTEEEFYGHTARTTRASLTNHATE